MSEKRSSHSSHFDIAPTQAIRRRRSPWRWLVAFSATILMAVAGSGLVAFAQTGGAAAGPSFLPAGAPIYLEVRADLPSGQDDALARMMSAFPGFADPAAFDVKVTGVLDEYLAEGTQGLLTWTGDVRSWFSGEISIGITELPASVERGGGEMPVLLGLSTSDPDAFDAAIAKLMEQGGSDVTENVTTVTHQDSQITLAPGLAFAVLDDLILMSNEVDQVKLGLDVLAGTTPSLASDTGFQAAFARVPDAHLGAGYVDFDAFRPLIEQGLQASDMAGLGAAALELLPTDATWYASVQPDGATFEMFVTMAPGSPTPFVGESDLAASFPGGTQVYLEARELGESVSRFLDQITATMDGQVEGLESLGQMLGGPLDEILAWAGDIAIGAALEESELWLGLGAEVTDTAAAQELVTGLLAMARLMGSQPDSPFSVETSVVGGVTVTTITLQAEGMTDQLPVPIRPSLSVALDGERLLIGTGSYVGRALVLAPELSLAGEARYISAAEALGTPNGGFLFTDISGLSDTLAPLLAFSVPDYAEMALWIEPFDRLVAGTRDLDGVQALTVRLFLR